MQKRYVEDRVLNALVSPSVLLQEIEGDLTRLQAELARIEARCQQAWAGLRGVAERVRELEEIPE